MALAAGTRLGPYEILEPIGAGGMGEVYRAHDPRVGRDVAIKVSSEQFTDRFASEIHAVAALNHSNVCTLYDVGPDYLVMELVEGPTLADRIRQGAIPLDESLEIARQIADALEAAHEKGIVHRDLKPGNIKIKPDGTVKVLDFGLAKVGNTPVVSSQDSPTLSVAQTAGGVILGTAAYMSPEQARGKPVDKRADIWAFGVVLYEILTGKQLFSGDTVSDTLAAVLKEEPDFEKVPAKVRALLHRCLEKDPKKRLRDIGDAMTLIEGVQESAPTKRSWLAWSIAALAVLVAVVLAFVHFSGKAPAPPNPVQFQITPPISLANHGSFAISPDGRHLAFAGIRPDGATCLYVRALNSLEAKFLPGTESSILPPFFWSPDSRYIAFDSGGKLKKVSIDGGLPQTLCDISGLVLGGSWNRNGVIIFGSLIGSLNRVSSSGGIAISLTRLNPARQETSHAYPAFLPDGNHFLYLCASTRGGICMGSLDSEPEKQDSSLVLATNNCNFAYIRSEGSGQGYLLFLRERILMAQPFDEKRMKKVGEAVSLAEPVGTYSSYYAFFSAPTNGILIYRSGSANQLSLATWYDRQGKSLGTVGNPASFYGLALSPDGSMAAMGWQNAGQSSNTDIWLHSFRRGTNTRFTLGRTSLYYSPVWSPDGNSIVFSSGIDDGGLNLYQKLSSGAREEELLLKSREFSFATSWSSDGRFLLYNAFYVYTLKSDVMVLPMNGDRKPIPFVHTKFNELDGRFSPDMRWVAYTSDESGRNEVYVRGFSKATGGPSPEAAGPWLVSREGGMGPRWGRDGRELYYRAPDGKVMAVEVAADPVFQAGIPKPLFQAPPDLSEQGNLYSFPIWDVIADGSRFLIPAPIAESSPSPFTVILNWTSLLKK